MKWCDEGIVLSSRKHGETAAIVTLLTRSHGRHLGLVRGGSGRRARGLYQPGNCVYVTWHGRLPEHLGTFSCELESTVTSEVLHEPMRLAALCSACAILDASLPERENYVAIFEGIRLLIKALAHEEDLVWMTVYVKWEVGLLQELGFGLDLKACAATGVTKDLAFVSPKTGRAVSINAAKPYESKMLPLPAFLLPGGGMPARFDIVQGLRTTGYMLNKNVFYPSALGRTPDARARFMDRLKA